MHDRIEQNRRHLALFFDRRDDRAATFFQLAQLAQALFQQAQLDVIEATGGFLAVAGDKWHGRTFVEQGDGGGNLCRFGGEFKRQALFYGWEHVGEESVNRISCW